MPVPIGPEFEGFCMIIDEALLDKLTAEAKASARLRMNYDLRNSEADGSQRMVNAIEPGTVMPIHWHKMSCERDGGGIRFARTEALSSLLLK